MGVTSTFGGSALDRHVFDFETVPDDTGGGAAAVVPDGGAGDAGELGGDAGTGDGAWQGPSQEEWEQTQQALEYFAGLLQPVLPQPPDGGQQQVQLDPLEDNFTQQLDQYLEQKLGPYAEYVQAQQFREGEARAQDILADDIARNGDFLFEGSKDQARQLANNLILETNQQYPGDPVRAAEAALELAAKQVREWEAEVGKRYHEREINQLSTLSGARREMPAGANGSQQFTIPPGGSLVDVAYRHGGPR